MLSAFAGLAIALIACAEHRSPIKWLGITLGIRALVWLIPVELIQRLALPIALVVSLILMTALNKPLRGQTWGSP